MALHLLDDIQSLVKADRFAMGSQTCRNNIRELGLVRSDVARMLMLLQPSDHHREWPAAGSDFGDVQADAYRLQYDEIGQCRCAARAGLEFYIKVGIATNAAGDVCVVASFHLSR